MNGRIDINCDLGEGGGADEALMPFISSANIACAGHAGDLATMRATLVLAQRHGVAMGAHPGFLDREHFGRREVVMTTDALVACVVAQVHALQAVARAVGATVRHVKLHGALYHRVSGDAVLAEALIRGLREQTPLRILYVLAGSELERVARLAGDFIVVPEVFADRTYRSDGSLTPRSWPGSVLVDVDAAIAQVLGMIRRGVVGTIDGGEVRVTTGTVCLHGDAAHAVVLARALRQALAAAGVAVAAPVDARPGGEPNALLYQL
jgi:UPF0271 protein